MENNIMFYVNGECKVLTNMTQEQDHLLNDWFNKPCDFDDYNMYLRDAVEVGEKLNINSFYLISVKNYILNIIRVKGYHEFILDCNETSGSLTITKQRKLNKSGKSFDELFIIDEMVITPFVDLYKHYVAHCVYKPMGKVAFSKMMREWCPMSVSKQKWDNGKPVRALTAIEPRPVILR